MSERHVPDADLSALVDGDLPARDAERVREHAAACADCGARLDAMTALVRVAGSLDAPEPPAALWAQIEGELERREAPWLRLRPYLVGALGGALATAAVLLLRVHGAPAPATAPVAVAPAPEVDPLLREAEDELERASRQYERAIERLSALLATAEPRWSPAARTRYRDRLARLDEAIARVRASAGQEPGDVDGHDMLFAAYQRKITFLTDTIHRGDEEAMP